MKKLVPVLLIALLGLFLCGCTAPGSASGPFTPSNAVDFVSGVVSNIMADSNLVSQISNAWDQADTPSESAVTSAPPAAPAAAASTGLPKIGAGKTITGWAPVNHWWRMDDAAIRDGLAYMQSQNVRWFCPEAVGNAGEDVLGTPAKLERMKSRWLLTQAECKARGIWFAPILFNDNAGDGSYQNGGIPLSKRMAEAKAFIDWIAKNGDKSVLSITVVAETGTSAGTSLENYGGKKLAGFRIDYNHGSRPSSKPSWATGLICWHTCDVNSWPKPNTIWLNDCGSSIRESVRAMNMNGDLNGLGNPAAIEKKKKEAVARGQYVFSVYGFQVKVFDKPAIRALSMPADAPPASTFFDLSRVTWLHTDVSKWPVTTKLDASVSRSGVVTLKYDKANVWPAVDGLNANPWIFVKWTDGKWYGATWEWLKKGQQSKSMGGKSWGDHIKRPPLSGWEPKSGGKCYMMVSGLCRSGTREDGIRADPRNVPERSNPVLVVFP
jgi:hypothetical protein